MSNALKKITTRAKQLKKKYPNTKWVNLVKKAGVEYRGGKLGSSRVSSPKPKRVSSSVGASKKRKSVSSPSPTSKNTTLGFVSASKLKSELKARIKNKIDKVVVQRYHATKKRIKTKLGREITKAKAELRKLS